MPFSDGREFLTSQIVLSLNAFRKNGEFTVTKTHLLARLCFSLPGSFIALNSQVIADPNEAISYMSTLYSKTCLKRPLKNR